MQQFHVSILGIVTIAVLVFTSLGCTTSGRAERTPTVSEDDACFWLPNRVMMVEAFTGSSAFTQRGVDYVASDAPVRLVNINERCSGITGVELEVGLTPLQFAAWKLSDRHLPIFGTLLRHGADVNTRVVSGPTEIELVEDLQSLETQENLTDQEGVALAKLTMQLLYDSDESPKDDPRYAGATAVHMAAEKRGTSGVLGLMIEAGADLAVQSDAGATGLHFAASRGDVRNVRVLLEAGANANVSDVRGWTPLHWAASEGNDAQVIVELIDRGGADPAAKTDSGETAYDLILSNEALKDSEAAYVLEPR